MKLVTRRVSIQIDVLEFESLEEALHELSEVKDQEFRRQVLKALNAFMRRIPPDLYGKLK